MCAPTGGSRAKLDIDCEAVRKAMAFRSGPFPHVGRFRVPKPHKERPVRQARFDEWDCALQSNTSPNTKSRQAVYKATEAFT